MTKLSGSSRLKVKRDTYYLPDPEGGVYFRNNESSLRMKGNSIYQWIEALIPMFTGEQSLEELTKGLTAPYKRRVYEIGETLYKSGFVRDLSKEEPHQLSRTVLEKFSSQIEFIEAFVDSGAYHFQEFREAKVLAVGAGPILVSMVSALIETGLPKFNFLITNSRATNRERLYELVENAREVDSEVEVKEVQGEGKNVWKKAVRDVDWVLYVSQDGNVNELRNLQNVCKEEKKVFIPAICIEQIGLTGPVVSPESDGCWESAWRRLHQSALQGEEHQQRNHISSTNGSILANVLVFEFFKRATGIASPSRSKQIYLLNLETLEGNWLSFLTHPLVSSTTNAPRVVEDLNHKIQQGANRNSSSTKLLEYFSRLTSEKIGIFHSWEERNLPQLPLAQCFVQAANPVSEGPAALLSEVVCAGFTHEEAKRNAGLTGIEMYVARLLDSYIEGFKNQNNSRIPEGFIGIGAGETIEEAVCRGLQRYLDEELTTREEEQQGEILQLQLGSIEDERCRYYYNALTTLDGPAVIVRREDIHGFPVIGVWSNGHWFTKAGLTITLAVRNALQQALISAQNQEQSVERNQIDPAEVLKKSKSKLNIPACDELTQLEILQASIQVLNENGKRLMVYDIRFEPFLKEELAGVYGVQIRKDWS